MTQVIGKGRYGRETYPSAGGAGGSGRVKINEPDALADFLDAKLIPGANVTLTQVDLGGGVLALSIAATVPVGASDHKVLVDGGDTTAGFLTAKIAAGAAIAFSVLNPGGDEQISIAVSGLTNAEVAAGAAIAGTKISPDFGAQNILTTGTITAGAANVSAITVTGLGSGIAHVSAGGVFSSSLVVNSDIAVGAAIDGAKINPDFGAQNVLTTGTLSAGATTLSGLTVSSFGTGVVHSDGAGVLSSSLIVNSDISGVAAISVAKFAPGAVNTVLNTNGGGIPNWALLVDANIAVGAAILGTKISPNFGAQNISTTGTLSLGASPATGSLINISHGQQIAGRNNANTQNRSVVGWGVIANDSINVGDSLVTLVRIQASASVTVNIGAAAYLTITTGGLSINDTAVNPLIIQAPSTTAGATGQKLLTHAQDVTGTGTVVGGIYEAAGGAAGSGTTTNATGGAASFHAGDANNATTTNIGGHLALREGRGVGAGAQDGNVALHTTLTELAALNFQGMQRGLFVGNAAAIPTGDPVGGAYWYVSAGATVARGSSGSVTTMAPA